MRVAAYWRNCIQAKSFKASHERTLQRRLWQTSLELNDHLELWLGFGALKWGKAAVKRSSCAGQVWGPRGGHKNVRISIAALLLTCGSLVGCQLESQDPPARTRPLNVMLIVIDTLRADGMSLYGNPGVTTPHLDAFARDAIIFENAYAAAPNTVPSHASLFTSTYPATHQVWNSISVENGEARYPRISENQETLAEVLQAAGYQTAAIADGGFLSPKRGFAQGFDAFFSRRLGVQNRFFQATRWIEQRDPEAPFFLFLHTYEVHSPYLPPAGSEDQFSAGYDGPLRPALEDARAWVREGNVKDPFVDVQLRFFHRILKERNEADLEFLRALYDAEVNYVDDTFLRMMSDLEARGLMEDTLIVVTSDHGEQFREHGDLSHSHVYEEGLRIPLIIRHPDGPVGVRHGSLVDLVDVMPTILSVLGLPIPVGAVGRPVDLAQADGEAEPRFLVGESNPSETGGQVSVRSERWSVILHGPGYERVEVFDRRTDPGERSALAESPELAEIVALARRVAEEHMAEAVRHRDTHGLGPVLPQGINMSEEERNQLRALGYIQE